MKFCCIASNLRLPATPIIASFSSPCASFLILRNGRLVALAATLALVELSGALVAQTPLGNVLSHKSPAPLHSQRLNHQQLFAGSGSSEETLRYFGPKSTPLLDSISRPEDMNRFTVDELKQLSYELRWDVLNSVSKTGGHLGSSLGVVELTVRETNKRSTVESGQRLETRRE